MASDPTVACILLTRDRPEMTARAVASFRAQTYGNACMLIFNTGGDLIGLDSLGRPSARKVAHWHRPEYVGKSIGELRNLAIHAEADWWGFESDIIATFDSDDVSHASRISEQVALLQSSGADCVGYNEAVFWDERQSQAWLWTAQPNSRMQPLGASQAFPRRVWQQKPFAHTSRGEDLQFVSGLKVAAVSSVAADGEPRLICSIHGGNSSSRISPGAPEWRRSPEFDDWCRRAMALQVNA